MAGPGLPRPGKAGQHAYWRAVSPVIFPWLGRARLGMAGLGLAGHGNTPACGRYHRTIFGQNNKAQ